MNKKSIQVNDARISYLEVNEEKDEIIFFIHGNSCSSKMWLQQLGDPALSQFRMIAFDLPGHGHSSAIPLDQYNLLDFALIISNAIKALSLGSNYHLAGISLGANIVVECLPYLDPKGIVLAGPTIVGTNFPIQDIIKPEVNLGLLFSDEAMQEEIEAYFNCASHSMQNTDKVNLINDYKTVGTGFRPALLQSSIEAKFNDEIELLKNSNTNCLVVFGADDELCRTDYLDNAGISLWKNKIQKVRNASHFVNMDQPQIFNEMMAGYLISIR